MKKSFALLAVAAALCASTSASALNFTKPLGAIRILGGPALSSSGGLILPLGSNSSYCSYAFEWLNPKNAEDVALCEIREVRPFGTSCAAANLHDIDTQVDSVAGNCYGYTAAGAEVATTLHLTEFSGAVTRMQGVAIQGGVTFPVRLV